MITESQMLRPTVCRIRKGHTTILVAHNEKFVCIVKPDVLVNSDEAFVPMCSVSSTPSSTHEKWLHVLGKMITKRDDSKYFDTNIFSEHLNNGNISKHPELRDEVRRFVKSVVNQAKE